MHCNVEGKPHVNEMAYKRLSLISEQPQFTKLSQHYSLSDSKSSESNMALIPVPATANLLFLLGSRELHTEALLIRKQFCSWFVLARTPASPQKSCFWGISMQVPCVKVPRSMHEIHFPQLAACLPICHIMQKLQSQVARLLQNCQILISPSSRCKRRTGLACSFSLADLAAFCRLRCSSMLEGMSSSHRGRMGGVVGWAS